MGHNHLIPRSTVTPFGVAYLVRRNPWVPVWWSVILPGFGHLSLGQHLKGLVLMSLEIFFNQQSHLNLAIYHTILGEYAQARAILDIRWAMLYPPFYLFGMCDCYRLAVQFNQLTRMERLQSQRLFDRISVTMLGTSAVMRRNPLLAAFWSAVMVGLGQLHNEQVIKAVILVGWYIAVVLHSGLPLAAFYTVTGQWERVGEGIDVQWILFWPSVYVFSIADAYMDAVDQNGLVDLAFEYRMTPYLLNPGDGREER